MARIFLDHREIERSSTTPSLREFLSDLKYIQLPPNNGIRQINIDGLPLAELLQQGAERHNCCEWIEIFTAPVTEIAREAISNAIQYLDRMETIKSFNANIYRNFRTVQNLKEILEGFRWLDLLISRLERDFCKGRNRAADISEQRQRLAASIEEVRQLYDKNDFASEDKILEKEVLPAVPVWKERLNSILMNMNVRS